MNAVDFLHDFNHIRMSEYLYAMPQHALTFSLVPTTHFIILLISPVYIPVRTEHRPVWLEKLITLYFNKHPVYFKIRIIFAFLSFKFINYHARISFYGFPCIDTPCPQVRLPAAVEIFAVDKIFPSWRKRSIFFQLRDVTFLSYTPCLPDMVYAVLQKYRTPDLAAYTLVFQRIIHAVTHHKRSFSLFKNIWQLERRRKTRMIPLKCIL